MRNSIVAAIAVFLVLSILSFVSCGGGKHGGGLTSHLGANGGLPATDIERTLSIEQAIAEARDYTPPSDVTNNSGFDPLVFEMLREEFIRKIEERNCSSVECPVLGTPETLNDIVPKTGYCTECKLETGHCTGMDGENERCTGCGSTDRITSAAPMGDAGKVTDLTYDSGTGMLNWTYVNVGDYDSSGEVGIPDITMIAQYYLANTTDGVGDDALENWIDGDKSGEVGISDITPIAQGYLNTVMEYRILTSSQPDSGFTVVGLPVPFGSTGVFPHTFSFLPMAGRDERRRGGMHRRVSAYIQLSAAGRSAAVCGGCSVGRRRNAGGDWECDTDSYSER